MAESKPIRTVNIRPPVSVYATYRRLSYRPWNAIAEFVDNSTQSYYDHRKQLRRAFKKGGTDARLKVEVSYDDEFSTLLVSDNANGMNMEELTRALVLDSPPPDTSGRCEFGMGLKTAACWFGSTWTVQTARLGTGTELTATVHVPDLVEKGTEDIPVGSREVSPEQHYTLISIKGLYKPIRGRTPAKIRELLGSMYRQDIRLGEIEITWNGEPIAFEDPPILVEDLGGGVESVWRRDIAFEVPCEAGRGNLDVRGWIGIRIPGSQRDAGFALLRRGRVIVGGPGENYKPEEIFGQGNTFRSQRLVGELHLDRWPVTQAKDALDWSGGLEDDFIRELKVASHEYMEKAEAHRERLSPKAITKAEMERAARDTQEAVSRPRFGESLQVDVSLPEPPKSLRQEAEDRATLLSVSEGPVVYTVNLPEARWELRLHWQGQISEAHWMTVSCPSDEITDIFLNTAHPFFAPHMDDPHALKLVQKFVIALALAERMARKISRNGLVSPSDFRNFMNRVLRYSAELEEGEA